MKRLLLPTLALAVGLAACAKNPPATVSSGSSAFPGAIDPAATGATGSGSATTPTRVLPPPAPLANPGAVTGSALPSSASIEAINDNSPLKPVFFHYDSDTLDDEARKVLAENAALLKANGWTITVEGHCDERGTAEYNLALGDRRALAARDYLVSLGVPADRLSTVSYGKEFPFDAGHQESSWALNRRAHFLLTAK